MLEELTKVSTHPDAKTLLSMVRRRIPAVSLGTIYRNLNILRDEGKIIELNLGRYSCHYDADISTHHHFFCLLCQKVFDLKGYIFSGIDKRLQKQGFYVQYQRIHLYGHCPGCRNKRRKQV